MAPGSEGDTPGSGFLLNQPQLKHPGAPLTSTISWTFTPASRTVAQRLVKVLAFLSRSRSADSLLSFRSNRGAAAHSCGEETRELLLCAGDRQIPAGAFPGRDP